MYRRKYEVMLVNFKRSLVAAFGRPCLFCVSFISMYSAVLCATSMGSLSTIINLLLNNPSISSSERGKVGKLLLNLCKFGDLLLVVVKLSRPISSMDRPFYLN